MPKPRTKPRKPIPTFRSEDEERAFWATADTSEYFEYPQATRVAFPNLKPSTKRSTCRRSALVRSSPGSALLRPIPICACADSLACPTDTGCGRRWHTTRRWRQRRWRRCCGGSGRGIARRRECAARPDNALQLTSAFGVLAALAFDMKRLQFNAGRYGHAVRHCRIRPNSPASFTWSTDLPPSNPSRPKSASCSWGVCGIVSIPLRPHRCRQR